MLNKNSLAVKKARGQSEATMVISDQKKGGQVTKPIIVAKMPCKLLYICHSSKRILNKMFNFLALLDIRVFGRL